MEKDDRGPYFETLFLEVVLSAFRFLPAIFPAAVIGGVVGVPLLLMSGAEEWGPVLPGILWLAAFLALSPVIASVLTLTVLPGGYGLTRLELGARKAEVWEREALLGALQELVETAPSGTNKPSRWLILPDEIDPNAFVVGTTIYVHSCLFGTPYLLPVLAHELGHLNHGDGRLVLALRRLVPPPLSYWKFEPGEGGYPPWQLKLFGGGLGLSMMTPFWNRYWQKRELLADRFAFECGQAPGLIDLLEHYQFFDVAVPFHAFRSTHPYHAVRKGQLLDLLEAQANTPDVEIEAPVPTRVERTLAQEIAATNFDRKQGFTDAEAVLDLVICEEDNAGWQPPEQLAAEQAWIRANGHRLTDLALWGPIRAGRGFLIVMWLDGNADERMAKATYNAHQYFASGAMDTQHMLGRRAGEIDWPAWEDRIGNYDQERTFVLMIGRVSPHMEIGYGCYLVGMSDGGKLPAWT